MKIPDWLSRLFTPRRSFAYRDLEERHIALQRTLEESRALVTKMYQYLLVYVAHLPPVEKPRKEAAPGIPITADSAPEASPVFGNALPGRPRRSQIDKKYREQMRQEYQQDTGVKTESEQRERVMRLVNRVPEADEDADIQAAIDQAAEFINGGPSEQPALMGAPAEVVKRLKTK